MSSSSTRGGSPVQPPEHEPSPIPDDLLARHPELRRVGTKLPLRDYLRELWARREFVITVPLGELKAQNQDTTLGQLWHLLNPLLLIGIYYFVFGVVLGVDDEGSGGRRGVEPGEYLPFLIVGVITFNYTRSAMQSGARMIVKNRRLVQSINFPRAILPLSSIVAETVSHFYAIPVMFVLLFATGITPNWGWLLIVPIVVLHAVFNLGASMATARFAFHFRDVQNFMPYALRLWLYMSGVLYPLTGDRVPEWAQLILQINPVWSIIQISRDAFLDGRVVGWVWALAVGWSFAALVLGFWYFRRAESEYGRV